MICLQFHCAPVLPTESRDPAPNPTPSAAAQQAATLLNWPNSCVEIARRSAGVVIHNCGVVGVPALAGIGRLKAELQREA